MRLKWLGKLDNNHLHVFRLFDDEGASVKPKDVGTFSANLVRFKIVGYYLLE